MKEQAIVLHNAHVVCMDENFRQFEQGAVVVLGNKIVDVGTEEQILNKYPKAKRQDCGRKILLPGLVNAHTHVPMTLLRGLSDDLRLDVWLMGYIMPVEREFVSRDFVRLGTQLACAELIRSGVTTFADMYYFEDAIAEATAEAGLRALLGQSVMKFPTPDAASFEDALEQCRSFIRKWKNHDLIVPCVAPHAPYTCTDDILRACASLAQDFDVPLQMHLAESAVEVENIRKEKGMPVIPYIKKMGLLDTKILGAHCVHIDDGEMRAIKNGNGGVAHNPTSNLKLASGIAPVAKMLECGINVGIGTDGPASNNDLDMFEEMRLAALLPKGVTGDPTVVPARTALLMGTRMGAAALHMDSITGSLEVGKRADIILLDLHKAHTQPRFRREENTIYSQIVYSAKASDVTDVMVNGKWLMTNHKLLTLDEDNLVREASIFAEKVDAFFVPREQSVLTKLISIGGAHEGEHYEVQAKAGVRVNLNVSERIKATGLEVERTRHYKEFDTYFLFQDKDQGYVRYREDEFVEADGSISQARYRLTHVGPVRDERFDSGVVLSRSRYIASAQHSLRFYREYFRPSKEVTIEKDRKRWLVQYKGAEFFVNFDQLKSPDLGCFLEVKSRTWSRHDAQQKAQQASDLLFLLGARKEELEPRDYLEMLS